MTSTNASSSVSNDPAARVPRLAGASGGAGVTYALWRPQMRTFLMRQGVKESDYAVEIAQWTTLVQRVEDGERADERNAIALLLGALDPSDKAASSSSSAAKVKKESLAPSADDEPETAAAKLVSSLIARSRKAFGFLYAALPIELGQLVADVPQGYAFGIWSFLEKRYRNTEQDSVATLWASFTPLAQETDEDFITYKARVDSLVELLTHAKQTVPSGLYASIVTLKLQPRYTQVVLALQTAGKLTDTEAIDWRAITEAIGQFERKQNELGEGTSASAMIARGARGSQQSQRWHPSSQSGTKEKRTANSEDAGSHHEHVRCFNCQQLGHYSSRCPKPPTKQTLQAQAAKAAQGTAAAKGGQSANFKAKFNKIAGKKASSNSSSDDESDSQQRAHMARSNNPYAALDDKHANSELSEAASSVRTPARTYAAVAMAYGTMTLNSESELVKQKASHSAPAKTTSCDKAYSSAKKTPSLDEALKTTAKAVDTAASVHLTCCRESLHNVVRCKPMPVRMADGSVVYAMHKGKLTMRLPTANTGGGFVKVTLHDVYFHERFDANLISWDLLDKAGWEVHGKGGRMTLTTPGGTRVEAKRAGGLAILEDALPQRAYSINNVVCATAKELYQLHRRLGHVSWGRLLHMCKAGQTVGVGDLRDVSAAEIDKAERAVKACVHCAEAKAHRKPLGHEGVDKGAEAGSVLHMDTTPIIVVDPITGAKRTMPLLSVKDSFTEWWWAAFAVNMRAIQQEVIDVVEHSHTLTGRYPRLVIADLGTEFNNGVVRDFFRRHGIQYQPSPARAKELNGLSEKGVDTLKNHARAMIYGARIDPNVSDMYSAPAFLHFVYVWNRTHIGRRTGVAPYQAMTGREASVLNIGEFGCDAYVHQHRDMRHSTLSRKSEPCIYLGHDGRQNCPRVLLLRSGKIVLSKDVTFREGSFLHARAHAEGRGHEFEAIDPNTAISERPDGAATVDGEHDLNQSQVSAADASESASNDAEELLSPTGAKISNADAKRYTLDAISDTRVEGGVKQYRCKWVGYRAKTWEPADTIAEDAPDVVREYEEQMIQRAAARAAGPATRRWHVTQAVAAASSSAAAADKAQVSAPTTSSPAVSTTEHAANSSANHLSRSSNGADDSDDESEARMAAAYAARCL